MVSHEHGNFIVNLGNATSTEVLRLIDEIRSRIDIPLQMEWHLWGQS
jgi:UDP-N-acetylmuramate dehydrogenase